MTSARHKQVGQHPTHRRLVRMALPAAAAALLTGTVVGVAVGSGSAGGTSGTSAGAQAGKALPAQGAPRAPLVVEPKPERIDPADSPYLAARVGAFSRSARRVTLRHKPKVEDREFMTGDLNLWPTPKERGRPLDVLSEGGTVALTGVVKAGFAQILLGGQIRWVNNDYLSDKRPVKQPVQKPGASPASSSAAVSGAAAGVSTAPCADGSGTESGLTSSAITLFRASCNAFPALSSYGGYDGHGEHSSGRAIDFMVTDPALGQALADWARAHASELNLFDILWAQRIWTPVRSAEGWRSMPDRGSSTANHYDHVHISVN